MSLGVHQVRATQLRQHIRQTATGSITTFVSAADNAIIGKRKRPRVTVVIATEIACGLAIRDRQMLLRSREILAALKVQPVS